MVKAVSKVSGQLDCKNSVKGFSVAVPVLLPVLRDLILRDRLICDWGEFEFINQEAARAQPD